MNKSAESPWPQWLSMGFAVIAILICLISYFFWGGKFEKKLEVTSSRVLPTLLPSALLTEIWFSPSGQLLATYKVDDVRIFLISWMNGSTARELNFSRAIDDLQRPVLVNSNGTGGRNATTKAILAYAVSTDGTKVAWAWKGNLYYGQVDKFPEAQVIPLGSNLPVASVSIIDSDLAVVVMPGEVSLWDLIGKKMLAGTRLTKTALWSTWSRGPFRALLASGERYGIQIKASRGEIYFSSFDSMPNSTCIDMDMSGVRTIGTEEGLVLTSPNEHTLKSYVALENLGAVRALASYDDTLAVVGGDGPGLYLIRQGLKIEHLLNTPPGVSFIALNESKLAYATTNSVVIADLDKANGMSDSGKFPLALMFSLIGLVGFLRVIGVDLIVLVQKRRAGRHLSPDPEPTVPPSLAAHLREDNTAVSLDSTTDNLLQQFAPRGGRDEAPPPGSRRG